MPEHHLGGNGDWTKISRKDGEQKWDFTGHHAMLGKLSWRWRFHTSVLENQLSKYSLARKQFSSSPVQWELCMHRYIPWWKTAVVVAVERVVHRFGEDNGRKEGGSSILCTDNVLQNDSCVILPEGMWPREDNTKYEGIFLSWRNLCSLAGEQLAKPCGCSRENLLPLASFWGYRLCKMQICLPRI